MSNKKKVVMVDDEKELCMMVKENLEKMEEYIVITTTDPKSAGELCVREKPDLILIDVVMPEMSGPEVIQVLRSRDETARIPIIVASGNGEMHYDKKENCWKWYPNETTPARGIKINDIKNPEMISQAYGVDKFLAKPFTTKALRTAIQETLQDG